MRRFGIDRFTALLAAVGALGTALVLLRQLTYGVSLTPDSRLYIEAARNLLDGNGLLHWHGHLLVDAPPLFPFALAGVGLFSRSQYEFDNFSFNFDKRALRSDGLCTAVRNLPDYPIAGIRTGQYTAKGQLWRAELGLSDVEAMVEEGVNFKADRFFDAQVGPSGAEEILKVEP